MNSEIAGLDSSREHIPRAVAGMLNDTLTSLSRVLFANLGTTRAGRPEMMELASIAHELVKGPTTTGEALVGLRKIQHATFLMLLTTLMTTMGAI